MEELTEKELNEMAKKAYPNLLTAKLMDLEEAKIALVNALKGELLPMFKAVEKSFKKFGMFKNNT